jgi:hypothetical protein
MVELAAFVFLVLVGMVFLGMWSEDRHKPTKERHWRDETDPYKRWEKDPVNRRKLN